MAKVRFKVIINWQGELHEFYRHAVSEPQALRHSIKTLAIKVGYDYKYVRDYVMKPEARRWEVE